MQRLQMYADAGDQAVMHCQHVADEARIPDDSSEGLASRILFGFPAIHHLDAAHAI